MNGGQRPLHRAFRGQQRALRDERIGQRVPEVGSRQGLPDVEPDGGELPGDGARVVVDVGSGAPAPRLRGADVDRVGGNALPAQQRGHPAPRVRGVGRLDDGVAAWPQHPGGRRVLVVGVGHVVQHPDHDRQVDAGVVERQLGRLGQLPLEGQAREISRDRLSRRVLGSTRVTRSAYSVSMMASRPKRRRC